MGLFDKLFGNSKEKTDTHLGAFAPNNDHTPMDECFVVNFKNNGGIFVYCDTMKEIIDAFDGIVGENLQEKICCPNLEIEHIFSEHYARFFTNSFEHASIFMTDCEYLIAFNGSILFSSNQLGGKRLNELPETIIVFAKTSQIVNHISDGLRGINGRPKEQRPSNITTFQNFEKRKDNNFLSYGSCPRKMYLLLLEDLT